MSHFLIKVRRRIKESPTLSSLCLTPRSRFVNADRVVQRRATAGSFDRKSSSVYFSILSTAPVRRILECGDSALVNRVYTGLKPGPLAFVLEFGVLASIVNRGQEFPDEEQEETDQHNAQNHGNDDGEDIDRFCALLVLRTYRVFPILFPGTEMESHLIRSTG